MLQLLQRIKTPTPSVTNFIEVVKTYLNINEKFLTDDDLKLISNEIIHHITDVVRKAVLKKKSTESVISDKIVEPMLPKNLEIPKAIYEYAKEKPKASWNTIAGKFRYSSPSGPRKAAKRYADYLEKTK